MTDKEVMQPVAWADAFDINREGHDFWVSRQKPAKDGVPLYTNQQREWVGLTDEEIYTVENEYVVDYRIPAGCAWNFARDIEEKLKEKNNG